MNESNVKLGVLIVVTVILVWCIPVAGAENTVNQTNTSEPYYITIDPIGNHTVNEVFFINGTTNLPVSEEILVDIFHAYFNPSGLGSMFSSKVPVQRGEKDVNFWSCNITPTLWTTYTSPHWATHDITDFMPDYFVALVGTNNVTAHSEIFTIFLESENVTPTLSSTLPTLSSTPTTSSAQTPKISVSPSSTPTSSLPFALLLLTVTGVVILNAIFRKKRR